MRSTLDLFMPNNNLALYKLFRRRVYRWRRARLSLFRRSAQRFMSCSHLLLFWMSVVKCIRFTATPYVRSNFQLSRSSYFESTELMWCGGELRIVCLMLLHTHREISGTADWIVSQNYCQRILKLISVRFRKQTNGPTRETRFFCCRSHCSIEIRWCLWGAECYDFVSLIVDVAVIKCWHNYTYFCQLCSESRNFVRRSAAIRDEWKFVFKAKCETHTHLHQ